MSRVIDRATATPEELDAAIRSVRPGEPLTITENGKPRMQIVIPAPVVDECCAETVARIVAWLRAERTAWSTSTEAREICASLAWAADAIERGDWRNGGDNRG